MEKEKNVEVLQFIMVLYLFWEPINSEKRYQNTPLGSSISRLEVLIC